jgi:hypothetical protein
VISTCAPDGLELVEDRRRILAEPDVGVDVGDATNRSVGFETKRGGERRQRPAVLATAALRLDGEQLRGLECRELEQAAVRQIQPREQVVREVVDAQHPEAERRDVALHRCMEGERLWQEGAVEQRDEVFHRLRLSFGRL